MIIFFVESCLDLHFLNSRIVQPREMKRRVLARVLIVASARHSYSLPRESLETSRLSDSPTERHQEAKSRTGSSCDTTRRQFSRQHDVEDTIGYAVGGGHAPTLLEENRHPYKQVGVD